MAIDPMPDKVSPDPALMRRDYGTGELDESQAAADPIQQFTKWFSDAMTAGVAEPNVMTVATADASGRPSARILLLKGFDARGFVFYTNYQSAKARDLEENPRAALVFFWEILERQVRIEGAVQRVTRAESNEYFHLRPAAAQISAVASQQSSILPNRAELEKRVRETTAKYASGPIPLPDFWGGYRLNPQSIEFWQGRSSRLHDRLLYTRASGASWKLSRLSP